MSELVKMRRDEPQHEGGPVTADVHPAEVQAYLQADWQITKPEIAAESDLPAEPQRRNPRRKQAEASTESN